MRCFFLILLASLFFARPNCRAAEPLMFHVVATNQSERLIIRCVCENLDQQTEIETRQSAFPDPLSLPLEHALRKVLEATNSPDSKPENISQATLQKILHSRDFDEDECLAPLEIAPDLLWQMGDNSRASADLTVALGDTTALDLAKPDVTLRLIRKAGQYAWRITKPKPNSPVKVHQQGPRVLIVSANFAIDLWQVFDLTTNQKPTHKTSANHLQVDVRPGRRGAFEWLDADENGLLSRTELQRAAQVLADVSGSSGKIGFAVRLGDSTSTRMPRIRLVPLPSSENAAAAKQRSWFQNMDRNEDGSLSPNEFLGQPKTFLALDKNQDGLISTTEAEAASK